MNEFWSDVALFGAAGVGVGIGVVVAAYAARALQRFIRNDREER